MRYSTKLVMAIIGLIVAVVLAVWSFGGLTGGSDRISLRGTVVETARGGSFTLFCPGNGSYTVVPEPKCTIRRVKRTNPDQIPAGRYAEVKWMGQAGSSTILARDLTVLPADQTPAEELTGSRAVGILARYGSLLILKAKGRELTIRTTRATTVLVQETPDATDPPLDSLVEVAGNRGWRSVKADDIVIRRVGPDVPDTPGLPRVLLIGGPLTRRYLEPVRNDLKEIANVHSGSNDYVTDAALEHLEAILGPYQWKRTGWAVICFNFGMGDLRLVNGKNRISLEQYTENLQILLKRLKPVGAQLVWTTIPPRRQDRPAPDISPDDINRYNTAARQIMEQHHIRICELQASALPGPSTRPGSPAAGSNVLAGQITAAIKAALVQ